jgi:hypothetical protein
MASDWDGIHRANNFSMTHYREGFRSLARNLKLRSRKSKEILRASCLPVFPYP